MSERLLPFIISNGPALQDDPEVRILIRKQAMRNASDARRQRRRQMQAHRGSNSALDNSLESSNSAISLHATRSTTARKRGEGQSPYSFDAIALFSNYETARAKFRLDLLDLSGLTNFNVGQDTISVLAADPTKLSTLLDSEHWSYLEHIPSRYGSSDIIRATTNCVLGRAKTILVPSENCRNIVTRLYSKALQSLQNAISDESRCVDADVLAAVQMLSLYEILDLSKTSAWSHHINGSIRLIKHRTHKRFTTDFEKALFAAHVGPVISQSLQNRNRCYLAGEDWRELYASIAQESDFLTQRSPLTIKARLPMFDLTRLWPDINDTVLGPSLFDDHGMADLEFRCRDLHRSFLDWMEEYKSHCVRMSFASPPASELAIRRELFGAVSECLVVTKRLLATVCDTDRFLLEIEVQNLTQLIFDLQKQPSPKHSWLFQGHETGVASSAALTRTAWEEECSNLSSYEQKTAIRRRYYEWNKLFS